MATINVWNCRAGHGVANEPGLAPTKEHPTCNIGAGQWIEIETGEAPFDPTQLNPNELGALFGVGFLIVAMALVIAIPFRAIVRFVKGI